MIDDDRQCSRCDRVAEICLGDHVPSCSWCEPVPDKSMSWSELDLIARCGECYGGRNSR